MWVFLKTPKSDFIIIIISKKGFTSRYRPWEIVFKKEFNSKSDAADAEKKIKGWKSRVMTERVISGEVKL